MDFTATGRFSLSSTAKSGEDGTDDGEMDVWGVAEG